MPLWEIRGESVASFLPLQRLQLHQIVFPLHYSVLESNQDGTLGQKELSHCLAGGRYLPGGRYGSFLS